MDDNAYQLIEDNGSRSLAFRVPGDNIDLLNSLEYLAEYLTSESMEGVSNLVIVSDKDYQITEASMIGPKLVTKKDDDEKLYKELKTSLKKVLEPLVFTMENDMIELYRVAIRVEGSNNRTDLSIGLDLLKVELPKEGDVIYLIFEDGYRKMSRPSFERLVDEALPSLRQGPHLARDPPAKALSMKGTVVQERLEEAKELGSEPLSTTKPRKESIPDLSRESKVVVREFAREMSSMGYRKDSMFSRTDVHQLFFIGMKGPAVFFKVMEDEGEMESFLRVLSHRKDALGVLITENWEPRIEAISRIRGFIYLDKDRASSAPDVIREVMRDGGSG